MLNNTCVYNAKGKPRITRECKEISKGMIKKKERKKERTKNQEKNKDR